MKQYLTFAGFYHGSQGGMNDFIGDFDTVDECKKNILSHVNDSESKHFQDFDLQLEDILKSHWVQIYDTHNKQFVLTVN